MPQSGALPIVGDRCRTDRSRGRERKPLAEAGWTERPEALPTGRELVERYLQPLAAVGAASARERIVHGTAAIEGTFMTAFFRARKPIA
jgi:hypothetical protein